MTEKPVSFGNGLAGIVTEPASGQSAADRPALVLLNVGILHRAGPFRMNVDLARLCARAGFRVLRFDLSGIGDSGGRREPTPGAPATVADIRAALDYLETTHGQNRFVLWGLCTGALHAHAAALADSRVCGLVCLDGLAYRTRRFYLHRYLPFLKNPLRLLAFAAWRVARLPGHRPATESAEGVADEPYGWDPPPRQTAAGELTRLAGRGVDMLYVYSGDSQTRQAYNYPGQFHDMFPGHDLRGRVTDLFIRDSDHIFTRIAARDVMLTAVRDWLARHYSVGATETASGAAP